MLKNYISRTGLQSASIADARIVPTDQLRIPDTEQVQPVQDLGCQSHSESSRARSKRNCRSRTPKSVLSGSKSQLFPSLNVVASAQNNGLAGEGNSLLAPSPAGQPFYPTTLDPRLLGGLGGVWTQILGRSFPDYSLGFQLSIPLRNRAAQADITRDQLSFVSRNCGSVRN